jgi:uncharacterized membrane protein YhdT|tara:strand:- start:483 stop:815 length:333 start_codon:yes stop_codon:yes gene_type:complete
MAYLYEIPNLTSGIDEAIVDVVTTIPSFTTMLLTFVFLLILISGSLRQQARSGTIDFPLWLTLASLSTLMVALPMTLISGMINLDILSIVVTITILSGLWLFLGRSNREV